MFCGMTNEETDMNTQQQLIELSADDLLNVSGGTKPVPKSVPKDGDVAVKEEVSFEYGALQIRW
jgi:hypothetical protein